MGVIVDEKFREWEEETPFGEGGGGRKYPVNVV